MVLDMVRCNFQVLACNWKMETIASTLADQNTGGGRGKQNDFEKEIKKRKQKF